MSDWFFPLLRLGWLEEWLRRVEENVESMPCDRGLPRTDLGLSCGRVLIAAVIDWRRWSRRWCSSTRLFLAW
jgi:hypothetical protein